MKIEKLRQNEPVLNGDAVSSMHLKRDLEILKNDFIILKKQNSTMNMENNKLKNVVKKFGLVSESDSSEQGTIYYLVVDQFRKLIMIII